MDRNYNDGTPIKGKIKDTFWLKDYIEKQKKAKRPFWPLIPLTEPIEFTKARGGGQNPIHVDPYFLGLLLGDGTLTQGRIGLTTIDNFIELEFRNRTGARISQDNEQYWARCVPDLKIQLEKLRISGCTAANKHVPLDYKLASIEIRWELIQGLMDTDGTVDRRGHLAYNTISEQLALDVQWIARSLGAKVTITTKIGKYRTNKHPSQIK